MDILLIVILLIILIVCGISIFYTHIYNKFQDYIIRINEVESIIDSNLRKKYDLINRAIPIIKSIIPKDKEAFNEIVKLRSRKLSNFELYRVLERSANEINSLKEEFPEIVESKEIKKIQSSIVDIDNTVDDATLYYNDNISIYNKLLMKFPSNIVANISKYKEKLFFDKKNMNDEDYNDFKL